MIDSLIACATCANDFKYGGTNDAGWSILFMLAVIVPMLGGVIFFMIRLARREQAHLDPELRDEHRSSPASDR